MGGRPAALAGDEDNDEARFNALYDAAFDGLYAFFFARTRDPGAAWDGVQEVFLRAWRSIAQLRDRPLVEQRAWLYAVARRLMIDGHRQRTRREAIVTTVHDPPITEDPLVLQVILRDELQQLHEAIMALPEALRTVLAMQVIGGMTSDVIGEALELPAGTVRYRLHQARKSLRERLGGTPGDGEGVAE